VTKLSALSPAKINLSLRVGALDLKGFHPLESMIGFTDFGDHIIINNINKSNCLTNVIMRFSGPFGHLLPLGITNYVHKAALIFREIIGQDFDVEIEVEKNLPLASGLGGGTVNGGTVLRLLSTYWQQHWPADCQDHLNNHMDLATRWGPYFGSDGAMAIAQRGLWAEGYGENISPISFESVFIALFHPGMDCPTRPIFERFDLEEIKPKPFSGFAFPKSDLATIPKSKWIDWARTNPNDLEGAASEFIPAISAGIKDLAQTNGCLLARMSGSGAAFYGLFDTKDLALKAQESLLRSANYPTSFVGRLSS